MGIALLCGTDAFCLAILASASIMALLLEAGSAGGPLSRAARTFGGGVPSGVVDSVGEIVRLDTRARQDTIKKDGDRRLLLPSLPQTRRIKGHLLRGVLSFSLNDSTILAGNVWPLSQMSTSFLIFSCTVKT